MRSKRIALWREAARRRRDESDVRVHPDAGRIPSPHSHRRAVHGGREALAQIDAELAPVGVAVAGPVFAFGTVRWARFEIERNEGEAADLRTRAMECLELERELLERNVDLRAFLRVGNPAGFVPGMHAVVADVGGDQAPVQPVVRDGVGACVNCGVRAGTRWQFYARAQRLVPVCPACVVTMPLPEEDSAWERRRPDDTRPSPAVASAMSDGPAGPWSPAAVSTKPSSWRSRSSVLVNGEVDETLADLTALDGVGR